VAAGRPSGEAIVLKPRATEALTAGASWTSVAERGSLLGIWTMVGMCRLFGRRFARLLLRPVVLYFVALAPGARRASRDYLKRVRLPSGFWNVYAHCLRFAHCTLDRLFWVLGRHDLFQITTTGSEHIVDLHRKRRGALLLGAHLGSFEAMLGVARRSSIPLNIVGYFKNARLINGVLQKLNPQMSARLVSVEPGMDFVLKLKERIDDGQLVALLGDRVGLSDRSVEVDFLGGRVRLPSGPYLLAAVLRCPVYLTFGLYHEPNRYHLYCEPFAERIELPRASRDAACHAYAQQFAKSLERYCGIANDNWFNFYDYWRASA
jgi:predicted LPLAT superfamily acyltransferase